VAHPERSRSSIPSKGFASARRAARVGVVEQLRVRVSLIVSANGTRHRVRTVEFPFVKSRKPYFGARDGSPLFPSMRASPPSSFDDSKVLR
jgi:hypothetical protein